MQIQNKTLAEVFQDLTQMSGRTISFDSEEEMDLETTEAEDTENTNEEKIPEEQEETNENEGPSLENDNEVESGAESD